MNPAETGKCLRAQVDKHRRPEAVEKGDWDRYWARLKEWLEFHARHCSTVFAMQLVAGEVEEAVRAAERTGKMPEPPVVSDEVKEIWKGADNAKKRQGAGLRDLRAAG